METLIVNCQLLFQCENKAQQGGQFQKDPHILYS